MLKTELENVSRRSVYVASFSEKDDLLSQWRAYTPNGAGYSIGFEFNNVSAFFSHTTFCIESVLYASQDQENKIESIIDDTLDKYPLSNDSSDEDIVKAVKYLAMRITINAPIIKHQTFSEEKEWRIICHGIKSDDSRLKFRPGKSGIIPYLNIEFASMPKIIRIKEVVIGPNSDCRLSMNALRMLMNSKGIDCPSIKGSAIPYKNW